MSNKKASVRLTERRYQCLFYTENYDWAEVLWSQSKRLIIMSSYGDWTYRWHDIGKQSFEGFLGQLDRDYLGNKLLGDRSTEIDVVETAIAIQKELDNLLYVGELDEDMYDAEKDLLSRFLDSDCSYEQWGMETTLADPFEFTRMRPNQAWLSFWNRVWEPHICDVFRDMGERLDG